MHSRFIYNVYYTIVCLKFKPTFLHSDKNKLIKFIACHYLFFSKKKMYVKNESD